jgi:hypothetical protein
MSNFDEREKSYERKFQNDQELAFKIKSRRNRIVGHWAASLLGKQGAEADRYAGEIVALELGKQGEEHIVERLVADLGPKGVDRYRILAQMEAASAQAKKELGAP